MTKGRIARAIISDPDMLFFLLFLTSNKARVLAMELSGLLGKMILGAEGRRLPQRPIPSSTTDPLQTTLSTIQEGLFRDESPSPEALALLTKECGGVLEQLLPNVKSGTRVQLKGEEAANLYTSSRKQVLSKWSGLLRMLGALSREEILPLSRLRPVALEQPVAALACTAGLEFPADRATDYTLQLAAGAAAVKVMGREVDSYLRAKALPRDTFPADIEVTESSSTPFISAMKLTRKGAPVDPRTLGIKPGDYVDWLSFTATVLEVSTEVTLDASTIPTGTSPLVSVQSAAGREYKTLARQVQVLLPGLLSDTALEKLAAESEEASAAKTRDLAAALAPVAAKLHPLEADVLGSLDRMGVATPAETAISDALLQYDPEFPSITRAAVLDALDSLQGDGFDLAEDTLLAGEISEFFYIIDQNTSYAGNLSSATSLLLTTLPEDPGPSVGSR